MASLVLSGDTSGSITVSAPAVAGSTTQTLVNVTGTLAPIVSGTAVTASSTSVDFTGIPSWVKRITVMFNGVSTSGTSAPRIRVGNSGGVVTSGYLGTCLGSAGTAVSNVSFTAGFDINDGSTAATTRFGAFVLTLIDSSNNWVISGTQGQGNAAAASFIGGSVNSGGVLDRVRITTVNGTDTFDAGTINLLWE
jgi:hypothetical protein